MGLISFFKDAGEKLFGKKVQQAQGAPAAADPAALAEANREAGGAIEAHINSLGLTVTALTVTFQEAPDGVSIRVGQQEWFSTAASLGRTTMAALMNPWNLLGRLDDIAQDVENLQLTERVWNEIDRAARAAGASHELSERLRRVVCIYCGVANPIGEAACVACGAPLGNAQPSTCANCGYIITAGEIKCPNCGHIL